MLAIEGEYRDLLRSGHVSSRLVLMYITYFFSFFESSAFTQAFTLPSSWVHRASAVVFSGPQLSGSICMAFYGWIEHDLGIPFLRE